MMSTGMSQLSLGIELTIWRSWTVVTTGVSCGIVFFDLRIAYSWSEYPVPFPTLPPSMETATEPAMNRLTLTCDRSAGCPYLNAPWIDEASLNRLLEIFWGFKRRKPSLNLGVAIMRIFPSFKTISLTGFCGESGLQKTVLAFWYSGRFRKSSAAFRAPIKFGILPTIGFGKRATLCSSKMFQMYLRISSLVEFATAQPFSGEAKWKS